MSIADWDLRIPGDLVRDGADRPDRQRNPRPERCRCPSPVFATAAVPSPSAVLASEAVVSPVPPLSIGMIGKSVPVSSTESGAPVVPSPEMLVSVSTAPLAGLCHVIPWPNGSHVRTWLFPGSFEISSFGSVIASSGIAKGSADVPLPRQSCIGLNCWCLPCLKGSVVSKNVAIGSGDRVSGKILRVHNPNSAAE